MCWMTWWALCGRPNSEVIRLRHDIRSVPPYVLNARGNALASLVGTFVALRCGKAPHP